MQETSDPIETDDCVYEVNISIDNDQRDGFKQWLHEHIIEMLTLPGFKQAYVLEQEGTDDADRYQCTVHYVLTSRHALETYLTEHAERMRASGSARFGSALSANRRILTTRAEYDSEPTDSPASQSLTGDLQVTCLDCGTSLYGQYCYRCGQRDQRKLVSLGELFTDLVHDLVSWDTRFWRTVGPLLTKPGHLTNAYLQGQRMRFSPPLRMYLIASILFFLIASVGPQIALRKMDVNAPLAMDDVQVSFGQQSDIGSPASAQDAPPDADQIQAPESSTSATQPSVITSGNRQDDDTGDQLTEQLNEAQSQCAEARTLTSPVYQEFFRERAYQSCLRLTTREGLRNFALDMLDNLPTTLLFLLPLMALVNKFVYLFSRRYYVEHLLFYVHNFSFLFVFSTLILILGKVFEIFSLRYFGWIEAFAFIYVIYYFMRAMRVVYRQSRTVTFVKWLVIIVAFFALSMSALGILALITAAMVA
ncbi:MAG: DUF4286 family protein [Gammaproteobacteria bacterium]|nr:DUF4286 family protein [Gammaproteobacteria bacterium]